MSGQVKTLSAGKAKATFTQAHFTADFQNRIETDLKFQSV